MWQLAANGPQDGDELLVASGSYRNRYLVMHDMLAAYESGAAYEHGGKTWIEATGASTLVGAAQAETIARAAALSSNVMSIVYDATALRIRVSYETGTGETWEAASLHDYLEVDLAPMFALATLAQALQEEE
jgi:hypothetical protein